MCTIGPSIHDVDIMSELLEHGMVSGRVDLTWGPLEFHRNSLKFLQVHARHPAALLHAGTRNETPMCWSERAI
jgi:hypothetical protein